MDADAVRAVHMLKPPTYKGQATKNKHHKQVLDHPDAFTVQWLSMKDACNLLHVKYDKLRSLILRLPDLAGYHKGKVLIHPAAIPQLQELL